MYLNERIVLIEREINEKYVKILASQKIKDEKFEYDFLDMMEFDADYAHKLKEKYLAKKARKLAQAKFNHDYKLGLLKLYVAKQNAKKSKNHLEVKKINKTIDEFKTSFKDQLNQKDFGKPKVIVSPKEKYQNAQIVAFEHWKQDKATIRVRAESQLLLAKIDEKSIDQLRKICLLKKHDLLNLRHKYYLDLKNSKGKDSEIKTIKLRFGKDCATISQKYKNEIEKHKKVLKSEKQNRPLDIAKQKYRTSKEQCKLNFDKIVQHHHNAVDTLAIAYANAKTKTRETFVTTCSHTKSQYQAHLESIKKQNKLQHAKAHYAMQVEHFKNSKLDNISEKIALAKKEYRRTKAEIKNEKIKCKELFKLTLFDAKKTFANKLDTLLLDFCNNKQHHLNEIAIASNDYHAHNSKLVEEYKVAIEKASEQHKDLTKPYAQYRNTIRTLIESKRNFIIESKEVIQDSKVRFNEFSKKTLKSLDAQLQIIRNNYFVEFDKAKVYYKDLRRKLIENKHFVSGQKNGNVASVNAKIHQCAIDKKERLASLHNAYRMKWYTLISEVDTKIGIQYDKHIELQKNICDQIKVQKVVCVDKARQTRWEYRHGATAKIQENYVKELVRIKAIYDKRLVDLFTQYRREIGHTDSKIYAVPGTIEWYKLAKIDPEFAKIDADIKANDKTFVEYFASNKDEVEFSKKSKIFALPTWASSFIHVAMIVSWIWILILILLIFLGAFNVIPQFAFLATEGGLSLFGIIVCFILSLIVVLNFAAMVLYAVERKSFRHAQTKKRNDSIVYLEQQLALSHKKITQLYKTSKKSNELIYKKSLIVCKDTTDSTLKKLDQNITEKNAQLDKTVKHKDQEISKLLNQINKLNKQIAQLKNQITHAKEKGVKKTTSYI